MMFQIYTSLMIKITLSLSFCCLFLPNILRLINYYIFSLFLIFNIFNNKNYIIIFMYMYILKLLYLSITNNNIVLLKINILLQILGLDLLNPNIIKKVTISLIILIIEKLFVGLSNLASEVKNINSCIPLLTENLTNITDKVTELNTMVKDWTVIRIVSTNSDGDGTSLRNFELADYTSSLKTAVFMSHDVLESDKAKLAELNKYKLKK